MNKTTKRKTMKEIHEIRCDRCGKIIEAITENQADSLMKQHNLFCKGDRK